MLRTSCYSTATLLTLILTGCSEATSTSKEETPNTNSPSSETDPVEAFEPIVAAIEARAAKPAIWLVSYPPGTFPATGDVYRAERRVMGPVTFDVKKSESLVSPVIGVVSLKLAKRKTANSKTPQEALRADYVSHLDSVEDVSVQYAWQSSTWTAEKDELIFPFTDDFFPPGTGGKITLKRVQ